MSHPLNNHTPTEIDLAQLFQTLWGSKALIFVTTLITSCIAASYAFMSAPVYETSVHTLPPTPVDLANYNMVSQLTGEAVSSTISGDGRKINFGIEPITPGEAYRVFLRHLASDTVRQRFIDAHYMPAQPNNTEADRQRARKQLDDALTITLPKKPNEENASIVLALPRFPGQIV